MTAKIRTWRSQASTNSHIFYLTRNEYTTGANLGFNAASERGVLVLRNQDINMDQFKYLI